MSFIQPLLSIMSIALLICYMLMTSSSSARLVDGMPVASNAFLTVTLVFLGRSLIQISQRHLPFTYLGVPIFRGAPKACHLKGTADRIISKFACWKGSSLSLAGRACLVNSVIVSSLVHSMMIYKWPKSLLNKIDQAMRNFICTGSSEKIGFCTVN
ncbi:hypothetical protein ACS0TY_003698 [Phlomoides rotata]